MSFCVYISVLLTYADGIVLPAPTAMAIRRLLYICNSYAIKFRMSFKGSKTKCVIFSQRHYLVGVKSVFPTFWVGDCGNESLDQWSHLGHVISSIGDDFWICRSQVQIPAVPLFRSVITLSKLFTRIYSGQWGLSSFLGRLISTRLNL